MEVCDGATRSMKRTWDELDDTGGTQRNSQRLPRAEGGLDYCARLHRYEMGILRCAIHEYS